MGAVIRYGVAALPILIGAGGLYTMGKMTGPMKDSILPMQVMDAGMIATGIAILIRRPMEPGPYAGTRKRILASGMEFSDFQALGCRTCGT